ncbi:MAG TPA: helix-turn-helix domain-containing protein [Nitrososphaerales archaeon]|nr:helix-turn-helix domain-containing protein [Nitrososphaerales archaeon]
MRKVIIEIPRNKITDFSGEEMLDSYKVIQRFKSDKDGFAAICQIKLRPANRKPSELVGHLGMTKLQVLTRLKDGSLIAYVVGRSDSKWVEFTSGKFGYQLAPEITPSCMRKTFIGTRIQLQRVLSRLEKTGMPFKIISASEAKFEPNSLLLSLSESQRKTIAEAYTSGYFGFPKKTNSKKLARSLGISKPTLSEHLRKAEKNLLAQIFI